MPFAPSPQTAASSPPRPAHRTPEPRSPRLPRLARHARTLLTALSLTLCLAVSTLWLLTPFRSDSAGWAGFRDETARTWHGWGLVSQAGRLTAYTFTSGAARFDDPANLNGGVPDMQPHAFHHVSGARAAAGPPFRFDTLTLSPDIHVHFAGVPHWLPAALLALAPARAGVRLTARLRRTRLAGLAGRCLRCGYDLRATPTRCPECGAEAAVSSP